MKILSYLFLTILLNYSHPSSNIYRLENKPEVIGGCGYYEMAYKFSFVNIVDSTRKIGIILCPDIYGEHFFEKNWTYLIEFSNDSLPPKNYTLVNKIEPMTGEYVPTRVVKRISKTKG